MNVLMGDGSVHMSACWTGCCCCRPWHGLEHGGDHLYAALRGVADHARADNDMYPVHHADAAFVRDVRPDGGWVGAYDESSRSLLTWQAIITPNGGGICWVGLVIATATMLGRAPVPFFLSSGNVRRKAGVGIVLGYQGTASTELLHSQASVTESSKESCKGSPGNLLVVGDRQACGVPFSHQDDVVAASGHGPAECLECADNLLTTQDRHASHQAVTSTCCVSTVSGMPRSARTCKQAWMASRTLWRDLIILRCALDSTHPGMAAGSRLPKRHPRLDDCHDELS